MQAFAEDVGSSAAVGVGIILGVYTIGNDKDLNKAVQALLRVLAVTLDLVKGFSDGKPPAFKFYLHQGQAVD